MQCLWDEQVQDEDKQWIKAFKKHQDELDKLADERTGTWLAYFVKDMILNGDKNNGVEPKYRPRGYNEPPKE
jgi:protein O-mannosyl-transferase